MIKEITEDREDQKEYTETEMWHVARKMAKEFAKHNVSSPETKKLFCDIALLLQDKILLPRRWFFAGLTVIILLLCVSLGVGYKGYEAGRIVKENLEQFQFIDVTE